MPSKFVDVLRHVIDQSSKSPCKKYYIDKFLLKQGMDDSKYLGQYLFQLDKFKAKKDDKNISQIASAAKEKYRSLHSAWCHTNHSWTSFLWLLKVGKGCSGTHKLSEQQIADAVEFWNLTGGHFHCQSTSVKVKDSYHQDCLKCIKCTTSSVQQHIN